MLKQKEKIKDSVGIILQKQGYKFLHFTDFILRIICEMYNLDVDKIKETEDYYTKYCLGYTKTFSRLLREGVDFIDIKKAIIRELNYRKFYDEKLIIVPYKLTKKSIYWMLYNRKVTRKDIYHKFFYNGDDEDSLDEQYQVYKEKEMGISRKYKNSVKDNMSILQRLQLLSDIRKKEIR